VSSRTADHPSQDKQAVFHWMTAIPIKVAVVATQLASLVLGVNTMWQ